MYVSTNLQCEGESSVVGVPITMYYQPQQGRENTTFLYVKYKCLTLLAPYGFCYIGNVLLYRKRTVASSVKVRLCGSYAEDRGSIPGRFGVKRVMKDT